MTDSLRIGSVPYLNARPLIDQMLPAPRLLPPAALADELHAGRLEVALVPVAEILLHPEYDLVDGVAIAARGAVQSVIWASSLPIAHWRTLSLDPDSRTSVGLSHILARIYEVPRLEIVAADQAADARLIIGDPARNYRRENPQAHIVDLAEAWQQAAQLPFVFAVWAVRRKRSSRGLANYLREVAHQGLANRRSIAPEAEDYQYLTEHISYALEREEKKGMHQYAVDMHRLGLIPQVPEITWI